MAQKSEDRSEAHQSDGVDELERYRRAAEDALQLLDWSIGYLYGIRKTREAHTLSKGRQQIRQQVLHREPEDDPAEGAA